MAINTPSRDRFTLLAQRPLAGRRAAAGRATVRAALIASMAWLAACSGGDSLPKGVSIGYFTDSPVEGISYRTPTQSGVTDVSGAFRYRNGETITFSIGATVIGGPVAAAETLTPLDLVPGAPLFRTGAELGRAIRRLDATSRSARAGSSTVSSLPAFIGNDAYVAVPVLGTTFAVAGAAAAVPLAPFFNGGPAMYAAPYFGAAPLIAPLGTLAVVPYTPPSGGVNIVVVRTADELGARARPPELSALNRFLNVVRFLQSLDSDGDPDNGIAVHPDIADLFDGVAVEFDAQYSEFRDGRLNRVMYEASRRGYVPTARLRSVGRALDHFYRSQGLGYTVGRIVRTETDEHADTEPGIDSVYTYAYDASGNEIALSADSDADGVADLEIERAYDARGNQIRQAWDFPSSPDSSFTTEYTYDANGNPMTLLQPRGGTNVASAYTFDGEGRLVRVSEDIGVDGTADVTRTTTYTEDGNTLEARFETVSALGTTTRVSTTTFDEAGRPLSVVTDSDGDGDPDQQRTYAYDAAGDIVAVTSDGDGDGRPNTIERFEYDAAGNQTSAAFDFDGDGQPNYTVAHTHDPNGLRLTRATDTDADGTPESIVEYTYDAAGNVTMLEAYGADGSLQSTTRYTYDADGNQLSIEIDDDADGVVNSVQAYAYDADGNRVRASRDRDADGVPDTVTTHVFEPGSWWSLLRF